LFFVDDSGDASIGVITALTFMADRWPTVLKGWLGWRRWMYKTWHLPTDFELHGQEFISGHGEVPPYHDAAGQEHIPLISTTLGLRKQAYRTCLEQIDRQAELKVTTLACDGAGVPETYKRFVTTVDEWLGDMGEWGLLIVDGKDDASYRPAHRSLELRTRRIIEDPLMQSSRHSQLIQMADLAAHAAFQHLKEDPERRFMWDWYPRLLSSSAMDEFGLPHLQRA
jgi:hypothetical protein